MNIALEIRKLMYQQGKTMTYLAECISKKLGRSYTKGNLSPKFKRNTLNEGELDIILDELGYKIEFVEK